MAARRAGHQDRSRRDAQGSDAGPGEDARRPAHRAQAVAARRKLILAEPEAPVLEPADQRLTVAEAIHANTLGAAYQIRLDDLVGSVEVGKWADLIVLDQNILEIDPHDVHRTNVALTMMNGNVVHES
ncbi:amidohydrolase family protein [Mycolicibacterium litorale]|uniref:amidohydrolase family protein n=1 Tax=Mycolicibacterium litorale TaxID=758802 RepID=UPI003CF95FD4